MIPIEIAGQSPKNGMSKAEVYNPKSEGRKGRAGLLVYTKEREQPATQFLPLLNETYGNSINQNASFGGTPIEVHDGADTAYWTGTNVTGSKVTFNSTDTFTGWPTGGTQSVLVDKPNVGNVWQFDKGSSQSLSGYTAVTFRCLVDEEWGTGDSVSLYGWDTSSGLIVGNKVNIEDYIDETEFDTVQTAVIPLSDMGLDNETIYAFRMQQETKSGQAGKWYIDDLQIEETGQALTFITSHSPGAKYRADKFVITIADTVSTTLTNGAGALPLSHDQLLGVTQLTNGIILRQVQNGVTLFSVTINDLADFLAIGFRITNYVNDGSDSLITLEQEFTNQLIIDGPANINYVSLTISDDLSGLTRFNAAFRGSQIFEA